MIKKHINIILLGFIGIAFIFWLLQLKTGLILTNMRNPYPWGLYISGLEFFVGNASGALILSSLIYLFNITKLKPFAKLSAICAFANVVAVIAIVVPDIGRPIKLLNLFIHPNFYSPLIWDIIVLFLFVCFTIIYITVLMLPDIRGKKYLEKSEKVAKTTAPLTLILGIGIHVITAWIFATQGAREWWHTAIMAPDFITLAIASGTSLILLISAIIYGNNSVYIPSLRLMSKFVIIAFLIHLFFMYNDFLIKLWYNSASEVAPINIIVKDNTLLHSLEILLPVLSIIILFYANKYYKKTAVIISCILFMCGILIHRYLLIPGAFNYSPLTIDVNGLQHTKWSMPITLGVFNHFSDVFTAKYIYYPSITEIVIFVGVVLLMVYIILICIKLLPIINYKSNGS